ncbi:MAG: T9SS type A sorting domain-containing protein, partial [Calditrichaeota bacterium]|nr:T9SS type A sorting domain-containing protein [Calditrichota bacterium]
EGHNSFSDSTGPLIKSSDPSYVDIENGENFFEVWGDGRYLESGDTNDVWDVTWNTWSPAMPDDSTFFDYLWPMTPSKWTVDSSLTDFVACGESGVSSMGGGGWLVLNPGDATSGLYSSDEDDNLKTKDPAEETVQKKSDRKSNHSEQKFAETTKKELRSAAQTRKLAKIDLAVQHHRELADWRNLRSERSGSRLVQEAMRFVTEHRGSEFTPAALTLIAGAPRKGAVGNTSSKFLRAFADESKDKSLRNLSRRLACQALAFEGKPAEALAGLEEMISRSGSPRDSLQALLDAMLLYYDFHGTGKLQPRTPQVVVTDPYDLVKLSLDIVLRLDDPDLGLDNKQLGIPTSYELYQNYPNPFNPTTEIRFDLPEAIHAELKVFNILGQEVVTLVDDVRNPGAYRVLWDGKNAGGMTVASGVYVYQLKTANFTNAKKMVLIR